MLIKYRILISGLKYLSNRNFSKEKKSKAFSIKPNVRKKNKDEKYRISV